MRIKTSLAALATVAAVSGLFQGMLLFFLLGSDVFINYRLRAVRRTMPVVRTGEAAA